MPDPGIAVGGIRASAATYEMRVDATSETLQMLLEGLAVEDKNPRANYHREHSTLPVNSVSNGDSGHACVHHP